MIKNVLHLHKDILDSDQQKEYQNEQRSQSNNAAANAFNINGLNGCGPTPLRIPSTVKNTEDHGVFPRDIKIAPQELISSKNIVDAIEVQDPNQFATPKDATHPS